MAGVDRWLEVTWGVHPAAHPLQQDRTIACNGSDLRTWCHPAIGVLDFLLSTASVQVDTWKLQSLRYGVQMPGGQRDAGAVGQALRRLRQEAGDFTVKDAAAALGWSSAKLSRIETSVSRVKPDDARRLLDLYRADEQAHIEIERLLDERTRDGGASVALPPALEQYAEFEARAARISSYAALIVPGLLQIPEYAAAVIRATPEDEDALVAERLSLRLQRQSIFASSVTLDVIIDESVLYRPIGGPDVMRLQLRRLQEFVDRPNMLIRILPFSAGAHPALTGQFIILDFPHDEKSRVYCDGLTGGVLRSRVDEVERYHACFRSLGSLALSASESAARLASAPNLA